MRCYGNCDRVELFLNGENYGVREMVPSSRVKWDVKWKPGVLLAKCYKGDEVVATKKVETTGKPASVVLLPDRTTINANGEDVSLVAVKIVDSEGRTVPTADNEVAFEIDGPGKIIGVGNGNPGSLEPDKASKRKAFNGLCMTLVQSKTDLGSIKLTATSPGLETAVAEIEARRLSTNLSGQRSHRLRRRLTVRGKRYARGCGEQSVMLGNERDFRHTKLLIYGLFQKGRVLAQDAVGFASGAARRGRSHGQDTHVEWSRASFRRMDSATGSAVRQGPARRAEASRRTACCRRN